MFTYAFTFNDKNFMFDQLSFWVYKFYSVEFCLIIFIENQSIIQLALTPVHIFESTRLLQFRENSSLGSQFSQLFSIKRRNFLKFSISS